MLILSVELKNIKSHRDSVLTFSPGINVLSGPNGAGKSTIFEAIGYCLFGVNAQDFVSRAERFLSIGAKKGEIAVVFQPADGEVYRVTRTVGPTSKWLLAKKVGEVFEVEDHASLQETETRIATLLGLNNGRPLAEQFKLVIGPFQNEFLGPFVIRQPTKRQATFDEILGIDAWRKTFDGTKTMLGAIQSKMETLKAEVAGREEQVAVLPDKLSELAAVRKSAGEKGNEVAAQSAELERVAALLAALDLERGKLDQAQGELKAVEERLISGKEHIATQELLVGQSEKAAAATAAARAGKESYDRAEEVLKVLRSEEQAKLQLERKEAVLEKELSSLVATLEIERREQRESAQLVDEDAGRLASEEDALGASLAALRDESAGVRAARAAVEKLDADFRNLPLQQVAKALPYLLTSLDRLQAIEADVREKEALFAAEEAVRTRAAKVPVLEARLAAAQGEKSELAGRKVSLIEGQEKLGTGECPFFHERCRNLADNDGADVFTIRIEQLDREMALLDENAAQIAALLAESHAAAAELLTLERVRAELAKLDVERQKVEGDFSRALEPIAPARLLENVTPWLQEGGLAAFVDQAHCAIQADFCGSPKERHAAVQRWSLAVQELIASLDQAIGSRLKSAEEPVKACERKEVELAAKREELKRLQSDLAARRKKLAARGEAISGQEQKVATQRELLAQLKAELSRHEGLDARIAAAEAELERFRCDRDNYIANQQAAEELAKRRETLAKYLERLAQLQSERDRRAGELTELQGAYSAERHESARGAREALVSRLATLNAELVNLGETGKRLEGEVTALEALADEVRRKKTAIDELAEQGNLVKFLRNQVFKNVSAQLSERFREEISFRADRIYRSIAESDEELYWGENYQVILKDLADGTVRERSDDQLSGGQMMSAVVALRLALLQTIGARVAFFDEPTSNLDADRRENLARAFRAIDVGQEEVTEHWYDQLFLVSHDVSFTEITDQMIQLGDRRE